MGTLEGRDIEAMRLYEQQFARPRSAASSRTGRSRANWQLDSIAFAVSTRWQIPIWTRPATATARWDAKAKVAQLDQGHPRVRQQAPLVLKPTIEAPVEQFDLATVIKMSQAVAGEIVLREADRDADGDCRRACRGRPRPPAPSARRPYRIEAGATSGRDASGSVLSKRRRTPSELPLLILEQVIRTPEPGDPR